MDNEDVLTSGEVAEELRVSVRTVHRMVHRGTLPITRQLPGNGGYLFDRKVIDFIRQSWTPRPYHRRSESTTQEGSRYVSANRQ